MAPPAGRAAVDVGSAFTHVCLAAGKGDKIYTARVPTAPASPGRAVLAALSKAARQAGQAAGGIGQIILGHTLAAFSLLKCPREPEVALLVTRGFKDLLLTGRQQRPHAYLLPPGQTPPLVPRRYTFEITERLLAGGEVLIPLNEREVEAVAAELRCAGVTSAAVCLLHAPTNPRHELRVREILLRQCPGIHVSLSAEVLPEAYEYERAVATVVDALASPLLGSITAELHDDRGFIPGAAKPGLFLLSAEGSAFAAHRRKGRNAHTLFSSFAGGALAGLNLARLTGRPNLVLLGMGDSCTYIAVIQGEQLDRARGINFGDYYLALPAIEVRSLRLGGSSRVAPGPGGLMLLKPGESAAFPPAREGASAAATLTDAQLVLGRLGLLPDCQAGKSNPCPEQAKEILEKTVARPLGIASAEAAQKMVNLACASIAREIRASLLRKGRDPCDFVLVACGGAGPQYGEEIARLLGITQVLIPQHPPAFAALGMLQAGMRRVYTAFAGLPLEPSSLPRLAGLYASLEEAGQREMADEGFVTEGEVSFFREADLRLSGSARLFTVPLPRGRLCPEDLAILRRSFLLSYGQENGRPAPEGAGVEVVNVRVTVIAAPPPLVPVLPAASKKNPGFKPAPVKEHTACFAGERHAVPVYAREELGPGDFLSGPALVIEEGTTTVVWPGSAARVDRWGNLVIEVGGGGERY